MFGIDSWQGNGCHSERECSKDDGLWGIRMSAVSVYMSVVHFAKSRDASCRMVQGPVALEAQGRGSLRGEPGRVGSSSLATSCRQLQL